MYRDRYTDTWAAALEVKHELDSLVEVAVVLSQYQGYYTDLLLETRQTLPVNWRGKGLNFYDICPESMIIDE